MHSVPPSGRGKFLRVFTVSVLRKSIFCIKNVADFILCTHNDLHFLENYFFVSIMWLKLYRFFRKTCIVYHRVSKREKVPGKKHTILKKTFFFCQMWQTFGLCNKLHTHTDTQPHKLTYTHTQLASN